MEPGPAISPELQLLFQRADAVRREARALIAENERWRNLAAGQLRHMFAIGQQLRRRPTIDPR